MYTMWNPTAAEFFLLITFTAGRMLWTIAIYIVFFVLRVLQTLPWSLEWILIYKCLSVNNVKR